MYRLYREKDAETTPMTPATDALETRSADQREAALMDALRGIVDAARRDTAHYGRTLAKVDVAGLKDRATLAALPVLRKSDLIAQQEAAPPFGGLAADDTAARAGACRAGSRARRHRA
jgi:phenylacetate-CoA ligase